MGFSYVLDYQLCNSPFWEFYLRDRHLTVGLTLKKGSFILIVIKFAFSSLDGINGTNKNNSGSAQLETYIRFCPRVELLQVLSIAFSTALNTLCVVTFEEQSVIALSLTKLFELW